MSIPRMSYPQYRKARKLTHECCNYCDGNCLLLDDGEECVCVQSISYSLLCRWFRAAVLPLDGALYAEIIQSRDSVKRCAVCGDCIYTEIQPGEILPGLRGSDAPEARGRKAAEKIPASYAVKPLNRPPQRASGKRLTGRQ